MGGEGQQREQGFFLKYVDYSIYHVQIHYAKVCKNEVKLIYSEPSCRFWYRNVHIVQAVLVAPLKKEEHRVREYFNEQRQWSKAVWNHLSFEVRLNRLGGLHSLLSSTWKGFLKMINDWEGGNQWKSFILSQNSTALHKKTQSLHLILNLAPECGSNNPCSGGVCVWGGTGWRYWEEEEKGMGEEEEAVVKRGEEAGVNREMVFLYPSEKTPCLLT